MVNGAATIHQTGAAGQVATTVQQASDRATIQWQSFNVGAQEQVRFVQPSATSLAVNRILDVQGSQVLGRIQANGQVWLINPNGVLFGRQAQVDVAGLVASTLDHVEGDAGGLVRWTGNSRAAVVNRGRITATDGGHVALIGHQVVNDGTAIAQRGTVALGAGSDVTLRFSGNHLLSLQVDGQLLDAQASNGGLLRADGGQVLLTAGAHDSLLASAVNNTGVVEARTVEDQGGRIVLLAGKTSGTLQLSGALDASAPQGGPGGFVETSAAQVRVADGARVNTLSADGRSGRWLIDPTDFVVAASGGDISGATLSANLATTDVELRSDAGSRQGDGDVIVNDPVSWSSNRVLTLTADNSVKLNANITATSNSPLVGLQVNTGTGSFILADGVTVNLPNVPVTSTNALVINGTPYTVINRLGAATDVARQSLQGLKNDVDGLAYALGSDIDASATAGWSLGAGFRPAGTADVPFSGTFNGLGHRITGLTINRPATDDVGLFGNASGATISDVHLVNASIRGRANVGALAGYQDNLIERSSASGSVTGAGDNVGGLVGWNDGGTVNSSRTNVTVSGASNVGGLVGLNAGSIGASLSAGAVTGVASVGGLVGYNDAGASVDASQSSASAVATDTAAGGLVGQNFGSITASSASGSVDATDSAGGLVGLNTVLGTVETSRASGAVHAERNAGGLVGDNQGDITDSRAIGATSGTTLVGGLAGNNDGTILRSRASGTVTADADADGLSAAGGLVGLNNGMVQESVAVGNVSANGNAVGGLVGSNPGTLADSHASGAVSGADAVGGLVGLNNGSIDRSLSRGAVSGSGAIGGLVGLNDTGGTVAASYWDVTRSGLTASDGGTGLDATQMLHPSNFGGLDFTAVWVQVDGLSQPLLRSLLTPLTVGVDRGASPTKVYDATTAVAGGTVRYTGLDGNPVTPDAALLQGTLSATLDSANVGVRQVTLGGLFTTSQDGYNISYTPATVTVTPAPLRITAVTDSKVYDGTVSSAAAPAVTGLRGSDAVTGATQAFASRNVLGTGGSTLAVTGYTVDDGQGGANYAVTTATAAGTITPATLTLAAVSQTRAYDGTTMSSATPTVAGLVGGDTVSNLAQAYASRHVLGSGASTLVVTSQTVQDGNGGNNYSVQRQTAAGTITPAPLTVAAVSDTKVYDGTTGSSGTPQVTGLLGSDTLTGSTQRYASKNVLGTGGSTLLATAGALDDGNAGRNYTVGTASATGTITPATLAVTALAADKVYDATTAASVTLSGNALAGDSLVLGQASAAFSDRHAGNAKTVTVTGISLGGADAGNYQLGATTATTTARITPAPLTLLATADSKVYDGTTDSSATPTASGLLGSDTLAAATQAFASRHVLGSGASTLVVTSQTVQDGNGGNNYSVQRQTAAGTITPAPLTVAAVGDTKVYDGTTASSGTPQVTGLLGSDALTGSTQRYASKNVLGTGGSTLLATAGALDDGNAGRNYTVGTTSATGTITPATLAVTALAADKIYDATTAASVRLSGNALAGDSLVLGQASAAFSDRHAGNAKTVTVTGISLGGADAGNYQLGATTATTTARITPAPLTLLATADSKVYDGTTDSSATPTASGLLGSDTLAAATQAFASRHVLGSGASTLVVTSQTVQDGNGGNNYSVQRQTAAGTITPAPLTVAAVGDTKVYDGTTASTGVPEVTGLVGSDTLIGSTQRFASKHVLDTDGSTLLATPGTLNDGNGGRNYTLTVETAAGTITPAPLTIAAVTDTKVYDGGTASAATPVVSGLVGGDSVRGAQQAFAERHVLGTGGSTLLVTGYTVVDGNGGANYSVEDSATAAGTITPAILAVRGLAAASKVYDRTVDATVTGTASVLPIGQDDVTLEGTPQGRFSGANAGRAKPVALSGLTLSGADAGNYQLAPASGLVADITPLPLAVTGLAAADKVYDATTLARLTGTATVEPLVGDSVSVGGTPVARFATAAVGSDKPVTVSGLVASGPDAANYTLLPVEDLQASVTPATLQYVARPAVSFLGQAPAGLTGSITGLQGADTVASATTGQAVWTSGASAASPVGTYGITGSGLESDNYVFVQAPGNATALQVLQATLPSVVGNQIANVAALLSPQAPTVPAAGAGLVAERRPGPQLLPVQGLPMTPLALPGFVQVVGGGVQLPAGAFTE